MFCDQCGNEIKDGAAFCPVCGVPTGAEAGDNRTMVNPSQAGESNRGRAASSNRKASKGKKGKKGIIAAAIAAAVVLASGTGCVLYFTGDGYQCKKNMKLAAECYEAGDHEEALEYYEEALKLDNTVTEAYLQSAEIYIKREAFDEAVKILEKGIKKAGREDEDAEESLEDKRAKVYLAEADYYAGQSNYTEARNALDRGAANKNLTSFGAKKLFAGKKEEVDGKEAAEAPLKLREFLDKELAAEYGYASLGAQVKEFENEALLWSGKDYGKNWTGAAGIAYARICDWDGDGMEELLAAFLEDTNMILRVYEVKDGVVTRTAECLEERVDDMHGYDETWALLDVESGKYLYCFKDYRAIIAEGSYVEAKLYRYDGEELYVPFKINRDWGSSDFVGRAHKYDKYEALLSQEILYDATGYYQRGRDKAYGERRAAELFAEYGIALNSEKGIRTADNGYEELLTLNMWADYRNYHSSNSTWDTWVYHFNDWDSPLSAYKSFLNGETTLRMRDGAWAYGNRREEWTYQDILTEIKNIYPSENNHRNIKVSYAYLDCGGDGVEEMVLNFDMSYNYEADGLTVIISNKAGQLEMVRTFESWYRSPVWIDFYGFVNGSGSDGFNCNMYDLSYMDGNYNVNKVYDETCWLGFSPSQMTANYNMAFSHVNDIFQIELHSYTINKEEYYVLYDNTGRYTRECEYFISLCEQEGFRFATAEDIKVLINRRLAELKAEKLADGEKSLYWHSM